MILILGGVVTYSLRLYNSYQQLAAETFTINSSETGTTKVTLPDGSTVVLNAASTISYKQDYGREDRKVELSGEGYFKVKHDDDHPFEVKSKCITVKDVGTEFNFYAYDDKDIQEVTLKSGRLVVVNELRDEEQAELSPHQKATLEKRTGHLKVTSTVAEKEYVWMEVLHQPEIFLHYITDERNVTLDEAIILARFMSRIIDFRSSYTVMHSSGVSATAVRLAEIMGMSEDECKMMMIAGYLHDIGKLKVPKSVLEKNDKLTDEEFNIVKEYAYYTNLLLKDVEGFEQIGRWAALHHEKLNGYGYPFRLSADDIPMGARIIAIADIFSAVAEIRSYRPGMSKEEVIKTLREYVESGAMSGYIVEMLINNYDDIYSIRDSEVRREGARYFASSVDVD